MANSSISISDFLIDKKKAPRVTAGKETETTPTVQAPGLFQSQLGITPVQPVASTPSPENSIYAPGGSGVPVGGFDTNRPPSVAPSVPVKSYGEYVNSGAGGSVSNSSPSSSSSDSSSGTPTDNSTGSSVIETPKLTYTEMIERLRDEKIKAAESQRERAMVDADSAYRQSQAGYGATAEAIGDMGLTGSGYGEYINGKAYSQMRSDVQAANASYDASKSNAESEYYNNLMAHQASKDSTFAEVLAGASSGAYTQEQIDLIAKMFGFSEEERQILTNEITNTENDSTFEEIGSSGSDYDIDSIMEGMKTGEIEEDVGAEYIAKYNKTILEDAQYIFSSGDEVAISSTLKNADTLLEEKKITEETYQNIYKGYCSSVIINNTFDTFTSVENFESQLEVLENTKKLSKEQIEEYRQELYDKISREHMLDTDLYKTEYNAFFGIGTVTMFEKQYKFTLDTNSIAHDRMARILNKMVGGSPEQGTVVEMGGNLLYYHTTLGWVKVNNNEDFYAAYKNACSKQ